MPGINQTPTTYSKPSVDIISKQMLPGILSTSIQEPLNLDWIRQIVDYGFSMGLPMDKIYETKRNTVSRVRGIFAPPFSNLIANTVGEPIPQEEKNLMDQLFDR